MFTKINLSVKFLSSIHLRYIIDMRAISFFIRHLAFNDTNRRKLLYAFKTVIIISKCNKNGI